MLWAYASTLRRSRLLSVICNIFRTFVPWSERKPCFESKYNPTQVRAIVFFVRNGPSRLSRRSLWWSCRKNKSYSYRAKTCMLQVGFDGCVRANISCLKPYTHNLISSICCQSYRGKSSRWAAWFLSGVGKRLGFVRSDVATANGVNHFDIEIVRAELLPALQRNSTWRRLDNS